MKIVGMLSTQQEADEVTYIAKCFVVGQRARELGYCAFEKERILKEIGAIP